MQGWKPGSTSRSGGSKRSMLFEESKLLGKIAGGGSTKKSISSASPPIPAFSATQSEPRNSGRLPLRKRRSSGDAARLQLEVLQAGGLRSADSNGFSDPYCVVTVLGRDKPRVILTTEVISRTLDPKWNQSVSDLLDLRYDYFLKFEVWDKDVVGGGDFLGLALKPLLPLAVEWSKLEASADPRQEVQVVFKNPEYPAAAAQGLLKFSSKIALGGGLRDALEILELAGDAASKLQHVVFKNGVDLKLPGASEVVEFAVEGFRKIWENESPATLIVTSHRLIIQADDEKLEPLEILYGSLEETTVVNKKTVSFKTKTLLEVTFVMDEQSKDSLGETLKFVADFRAINARNPQLFAFELVQANKPSFKNISLEDLKEVISEFSMEKELLVQGLGQEKIWKRCEMNEEYKLCDTYPSVLYFPASVTSQTILKSAEFRSRERLPVLTYWSQRYRVSLARSAQPKTGVAGYSSEYDEKIVMQFWSLLPFVNDDAKTTRIVLCDARSQIAAQGNKWQGKGVENVRRYQNADIVFMDIGNIHAMRESFSEIHRLFALPDQENDWLQSLAASKWPSHVMKVLGAASHIVSRMSEERVPVLVHCSDGWDRTSQLCALAQLILEPRFRTRVGFSHLVEKDFCSFGHKFDERLGNVAKKDEKSPIFFQFLECVFQLLVQYPESFEFNSAYLARIVHLMYSGWFGTFLMNSEKERVEQSLSTDSFSLWEVVNRDNSYLNHLYNPDLHSDRLIPLPNSSTKKYVIWKDMYNKYDSQAV